MEAVRELHVDDADLAQLTAGDHLPRLLDELVAGVAIGDADDLVGRLRQHQQFFRFGDGETERLLANDVDPRLQRRLADLEVRAVGRGDRDGLQTVGASGLPQFFATHSVFRNFSIRPRVICW